MKEINVDGTLRLADKEDIDKGWIRISQNIRGGLPVRCYVRIKVDNRTVFCQLRGTPVEDGLVRMDEHYRKLLGIADNIELISLRIKKVGLLGRLRALASHPDDAIRNGIALGLSSVGLGGLSISTVAAGATYQCFIQSIQWIKIIGGGLALGTTFFFLLITGCSLWYAISGLIRRDIA